MPVRRRLKAWSLDALNIPPARVMLYLFMAGSALLFAALVFAHAALTGFHLFGGGFSRLPRAFVFSTLVLSAGMLLLRDLRRYFYPGRMRSLTYRLAGVCVAALAFAALQVWGWFELYGLNRQEPFLHREWTLIGLVSGLHLLHLVGALAALLYQTVYFHRKTQDPADEVIVAADPYYYGRIRTLVLFWYYIDVIWLLLFFYFLAAL